jgi:hypothetical protein
LSCLSSLYKSFLIFCFILLVFSIMHEWTTDSKPKLLAGSSEGYIGHIDGRPRDARLNHPKGITVDDSGNIYIADTLNMAIRKISDEGIYYIECLRILICFIMKWINQCNIDTSNWRFVGCLTRVGISFRYRHMWLSLINSFFFKLLSASMYQYFVWCYCHFCTLRI